MGVYDTVIAGVAALREKHPGSFCDNPQYSPNYVAHIAREIRDEENVACVEQVEAAAASVRAFEPENTEVKTRDVARATDGLFNDLIRALRARVQPDHDQEETPRKPHAIPREPCSFGQWEDDGSWTCLHTGNRDSKVAADIDERPHKES